MLALDSASEASRSSLRLSIVERVAVLERDKYHAAGHDLDSQAVLERSLARRIYLYAALLFGLVATVSTAVLSLHQVIPAALDAAELDLLAEAEGWKAHRTLLSA
jgi:hypothetical protein